MTMTDNDRFMEYIQERKNHHYPKCKDNCCLVELCDALIVRAPCLIVNGAFEEWKEQEGKGA